MPQSSLSFIKSLYILIKPFGLRKVVWIIALVVSQSVLQIFTLLTLSLFLKSILQPEELNEGRVVNIMKFIGFHEITGFQAALLCLFSQLALGLSGLVFEWQRYKVSASFNYWLKQKIFYLLGKQSYNFYLNKQPSYLVKVITQDAQASCQAVFSLGLDVVNRALVSCCLVVMLFFINPWVCLQLASVIGGSYFVIWKLLKNKRVNIISEIKYSSRIVNQISLQFITGIKIIKSYHKEKVFSDVFAKANKKLAKASNLGIYFGIMPRYIIEPLAIVGIVIAYLILTQWQDLENDTALVLLGTMGYAALRLLVQMQSLYQCFNTMNNNKAYLDEVVGFITSIEPDSSDKTINLLNPIDFKSLSFENVQFSYKNGTQALKTLNLHIEKSQRLGIIGKTGSGKSTLIDLILGLIKPSKGMIYVNNSDLHDEKVLKSWQLKVGYVPQDTFLLDESIAKNIALELDDEKIDLPQVKQVCKMAQIDGWIESDLENTYDTFVGERGVRLSGGQRQRIAIARALYRKPEVLILDEATSALDNETEADLMQMIYNLDKDITIIMVAHRLSTVSKVDRVISLKKGIINFDGSYNQAKEHGLIN